MLKKKLRGEKRTPGIIALNVIHVFTDVTPAHFFPTLCEFRSIMCQTMKEEGEHRKMEHTIFARMCVCV